MDAKKRLHLFKAALTIAYRWCRSFIPRRRSRLGTPSATFGASFRAFVDELCMHARTNHAAAHL